MISTGPGWSLNVRPAATGFTLRVTTVVQLPSPEKRLAVHLFRMLQWRIFFCTISLHYLAFYRTPAGPLYLRSDKLGLMAKRLAI